MTLTRITPLLRATCVLALIAGGFGCDDGIRGADTPELEVDPPNFQFPKLAAGDSEDRTVTLQNTGSGDLKIGKIRWEVGGDSEFQLFWSRGDGDFQAVDRNGTDQLEAHRQYPLIIEPGETLDLVLNYAPRDNEPDPGRIVLETNLGNSPNVEIPILISGVAAEINVSPRVIDYDRVAAGDERDEIVTVSNVGQVSLTVSSIQLNGQQTFTPLINGKDPRRQPEVLDDPDGDGEAGLAAGTNFEITVRFAPQIEGPATAELVIVNSDATEPSVRVDLRANGATPCLEVTPPALEFRTSLVNRTDSRPLNIESCGGHQLEITRIYLSEDSDPSFQLVADSLPELPALLPAVSPDSAPPSRQISVSFTPREQRIYNGTLIVESTDPVNPRRRVSLLGRGVLNACPQARSVQDEFNVVPLDVVVLDGSASVDQDGPNNRPVQYEWVITSRPEGSVAQPTEMFHDNAQPANGGIPDDVTTPTSLFFVDLAGVYTAELRVTDNLGLDSTACENPAIVTIIAKPEDAIHIQLVWRTPEDSDETDTRGADLDLHLLHPNADNWFSAPYDCYYANPVPDWGQLENPADDPGLDIDDINGAGPENANLGNPENTDALGAPYLVGVHYYKSTDRLDGFEYGPSFAKVRIFINGELTWDYTDENDDGTVDPGEREMEAEDHFWDVAQITWPDGRVVERDRYYNQRP